MTPSLRSPHLTEWNKHDSYRSWLQELLRAPEGRLLMLVLEEMSQPDIVDEDMERITPGVSGMEQMAMRHLLCSGQKMACTNIRSLAHLDIPEVSDLPPAWLYAEEINIE